MTFPIILPQILMIAYSPNVPLMMMVLRICAIMVHQHVQDSTGLLLCGAG